MAAIIGPLASFLLSGILEINTHLQLRKYVVILIDSSMVFSSSVSDCELEELEAPQRYRPDSLAQICKTTKFSESEIKRMYRGFKAHCPNGMVKEDTFKVIYAQFFPQGGS